MGGGNFEQFCRHKPVNAKLIKLIKTIMQTMSSPPSKREPRKEDKRTRKTLYTVGHSTRSVEELTSMLHAHGITTLIDVRTLPRSRTNPQHNKENLETVLPTSQISYIWLGSELGGLRKRNKALGDLNAGWKNDSFRGYADYMQTDEFWRGIDRLLQIIATADGPCCLMCAEVVPWRCHRSLLCDALCDDAYQIEHIVNPGKPPTPHKMTKFVKIVENKADHHVKLTYPAYEEEEEETATAKDSKQQRYFIYKEERTKTPPPPESEEDEDE